MFAGTRFDQVGAARACVLARWPKNGRVEGGCDMPMAMPRWAAQLRLPRPHDRTNFSSWMAGRLLDAVDGNTQTRGTRPTSTTASGAHKYVYVDSTLFVDSELDDKGQSVAVGRPRRALLFARPLLLTSPASIVGSLALARTSGMQVGASAALCRRKLGGSERLLRHDSEPHILCSCSTCHRFSRPAAPQGWRARSRQRAQGPDRADDLKPWKEEPARALAVHHPGSEAPAVHASRHTISKVHVRRRG